MSTTLSQCKPKLRYNFQVSQQIIYNSKFKTKYKVRERVYPKLFSKLEESLLILIQSWWIQVSLAFQNRSFEKAFFKVNFSVYSGKSRWTQGQKQVKIYKITRSSLTLTSFFRHTSLFSQFCWKIIGFIFFKYPVEGAQIFVLRCFCRSKRNVWQIHKVIKFLWRQWCRWLKVGGFKLMTICECWWPNFDEWKSLNKWPKPSSTSQSCHQHISCPTSVNNIDVTN